MITEQPYGRPQDKDIQKDFMKKIRGDKLQAINAECELEICLAFKYEKKAKSSKSRGGAKSKEQEADAEILKEKVRGIDLGSSFGVDRRQALLKYFEEFKGKWVFEEIEENQPLPDYFFDDGCDLSYIIYELEKTGDAQFVKLTAEDLIFLQLLCLEGRKHLSEPILQYYQDNMSFMIYAMKNGFQKIEEKLQAIKNQANSKLPKEKKALAEDISQIPEANSAYQQISNREKQVSQEEAVSTEKKRKNKMIQKKKKKQKGKGKKEQQSEQEQDGQTEEQLVLKTCNYISWAYWYVIKK